MIWAVRMSFFRPQSVIIRALGCEPHSRATSSQAASMLWIGVALARFAAEPFQGQAEPPSTTPAAA